MFAPDSVALVTGAATGIGRATALAFARAGCHVVLADRDSARGQAAAAEVVALGRDALFVATDVADPEQVGRLHQAIDRRFGRLDVACNNAGIEGENGVTADCSRENWDRVIGVNLRGVFLCMREQLRPMQRQGHGAIARIASVAGLPAYCASKGRCAADACRSAGVRRVGHLRQCRLPRRHPDRDD